MDRLDLAFWLLVIFAEAIVTALLVNRRVYRLFPMFTLYMTSTIVSDLLGLVVRMRWPNIYFHLFLYEMPVDFLLQFSVLLELCWSVLRPLRSSLPRWTIFALAGMILLAAAAVWPIAGTTVMHGLPQEWHLVLRLRQTASILQILFFVVLAAGSQLLSINWHDRELQVATGLGFYSLISLGVSLLHAQMPQLSHYHQIDQLLQASYLASLVYWAVSLVQKEAPRQEFTPQMQSLLLKVSGAARSGRISLQENDLHGDRRG
jgi:hypothetical protein